MPEAEGRLGRGDALRSFVLSDELAHACAGEAAANRGCEPAMNALSVSQRRARRLGRPPKCEARDTRAALLEAALGLFAQHGYSGTSIRAITGAVGLSESLLYRYFANKRAIFEAAIDRVERAAIPERLSALGSIADHPSKVVRVLVEKMLDAWDAPQARRLCGVLARDLNDDTPARLSAAIVSVDDLTALFADWMRDGRMRTDLGVPNQLVWELLMPVAHVRLMYLRPDAAPHTRQAGRELALRHAAFFAAAAFDVSE